MEDIDAALMHNCRPVTFRGGERSGPRGGSNAAFEPSDESRRGSDLIREAGHFSVDLRFRSGGSGTTETLEVSTH